jgi:hypothetical protein
MPWCHRLGVGSQGRANIADANFNGLKSNCRAGLRGKSYVPMLDVNPYAFGRQRLVTLVSVGDLRAHSEQDHQQAQGMMTSQHELTSL